MFRILTFTHDRSRFSSDRYDSIKKLEKLNTEDPSAARLQADWIAWRDSPPTHRKAAQISALGLHRDPSRGRTHIILQTVQYTPDTSKDPRSKFTVTAAGVFRIRDALKAIEAAMRLDPGEGASMVQEVLEECVYVYGKIIQCRYQGSRCSVRVARADGLVNKEYIELFGPGVRIAVRIGASRCSSAGSELKKEAGCDSA